MGIKLDTIEAELKNHMMEQPYKITCYVCGNTIDVEDNEVDSDFDMYLKVHPCQSCIDVEIKEVHESYEEGM